MKNYSIVRKIIAIIGGLAYLQSISMVNPSTADVFTVRFALAALSMAIIFFDRKVFAALVIPVFLEFTSLVMPWETVGALGATYVIIRVLFLASAIVIEPSFAIKKWFLFFMLSLLPMLFAVTRFCLGY
jgi:hypothetical protein